MNRNLAARAGRWSAEHWKAATLGWLAFVLAAAIAGQLTGSVKLSDAEQSTGESARAERILERSGLRHGAEESVLVSDPRLRFADPRFRATVSEVVGALRALPQTSEVRSPLSGERDAISHDGHSALVPFQIAGPEESAANRVQPVLDRVAALQRSLPGFTIAEFGDASAQHEVSRAMSSQFSHAEGLSLPVTFFVLLIAFGAFVAAAVPVILAFSAVLAALGLNAVVSHLFHTAEATSSVMLLMGMAVGVDYSLFYLKREREERLRRTPQQALLRAAATSGRAVLVSGSTVLIAMAGMLMAGSSIFSSIGIGAMIVVLVSVIGSVTVLPALLSRLGDRVEMGVVAVLAALGLRVCRRLGRSPRILVWLRGRRTLLARLSGRTGDSRGWDRVLGAALRHPAVTAAGTCSLLLAMALPTLWIHTKLPSFSDLPRGLPIVRSYDAVQRAFPGSSAPAVVEITAADVRSPRVQAAISSLSRRALASGHMHAPIERSVNGAGTVEQLQVPLAGNGDDSSSEQALMVLRGRMLAATVGKLPGVGYAVTGETAGTHDFNHTTAEHWPLVFVFVLGLAFLLLLMTFRSLVVPATAICLNLLSVGASYGALVWIFQDGHLHGLLGFHSDGSVVTWLPLFLFAVLFGLSMDYHVFIVSRVRELVERGMGTREAVRHGIAGTAGTVTAAAAVMVAVFAIFATLTTLEIKEMGVGLAVAVALDATVIRGLLLPSVMTLLGARNWYLPAWLPRVRGRLGASAEAELA